MKRRTITGILLITLSVLSVGIVADESGLINIDIVVAPNVLNLDAEAKGNFVTMHTDIAYADVDENCDSITLKVGEDGINIGYCYPDDRGNLVVKVDRTDVMDVASPPNATFTLTGETDGGILFMGTDVIRVIDCR